MRLPELVRTVENKDDFLCFLAALRDDLMTHRDEWENDSLPRYLEAMQAWVGDMEGFLAAQKIEVPSVVPWGLFAHILIAAKMYE